MMRRLLPLRNLSLHVAGWVLPPVCTSCGNLLPATEPLGVCGTCWPELPFWKPELEPMPALPPMVDGFAAPFLYEGPVRHWVSATKFYDRTELAPVLAEFMLPYIPAGENVLLVPVPLHSSRMRWRLFNQSALLAQEVAKRTGHTVEMTALKRQRKTTPQVGKTRKQRQQLSTKTFFADKAKIYGKHIVLIDDIWTTGATARACASVLKQAGATRVDVVTAAYVAP